MIDFWGCCIFATETKKAGRSRTHLGGAPNVAGDNSQVSKSNTMSNTKNKETLKTVLQFIVSVITALLATLGVQSCVGI